ncbi:MAG: tetratricopeptide repeat protein [Archaeoglobaceae archaeon]
MEFLERFRLMRVLLDAGFDQATAKEISEKIEVDDMKAALSEYENFGTISKKTVENLKARFLTKNVSELIFGVESSIVVFPEITKSLIGSGKHGLDGLRNHLKTLGFPETKLEEILLAFYWEAKDLLMLENSKKLLAVVCLELGNFYINKFDKKAKKFLNEAFELRSELQSKDAKNLAENLVKLADMLEEKGEYSKAEKALEKSSLLIRDLFENLQFSDAEYAAMLVDIGKRYAKRNPKRAIEFFESALKFESAISDKILEVYDNLIQCYRETGNQEKAHECELRRNAYGEKSEDLETL